jgi:hypothetical protein
MVPRGWGVAMASRCIYGYDLFDSWMGRRHEAIDRAVYLRVIETFKFYKPI